MIDSVSISLLVAIGLQTHMYPPHVGGMEYTSKLKAGKSQVLKTLEESAPEVYT